MSHLSPDPGDATADVSPYFLDWDCVDTTTSLVQMCQRSIVNVLRDKLASCRRRVQCTCVWKQLLTEGSGHAV